MSITAMLVWAAIIFTGWCITKSHERADASRKSNGSAIRNSYAQAYIGSLSDTEANREAIERLRKLK